MVTTTGQGWVIGGGGGENSSMVKVWGVSVIVDKLTVYQMYNWHGGEVHIV